MTHKDFAVLKSRVTVIFKIYQKHLFFCGKTKIKNSCILLCYLSLYIRCAFFKARKLLVKQYGLSENLTFQNLLKKIWPGQFFYYMKLGLSASMFCQI